MLGSPADAEDAVQEAYARFPRWPGLSAVRPLPAADRRPRRAGRSAPHRSPPRRRRRRTWSSCAISSVPGRPATSTRSSGSSTPR
ncbi:hypothetical protein [Streptomyces sp. NPDC048568]|uniref:hypothetical protein n=1 Tax=Streptomyces sp. NPDC048568 TaxID=3365571 RepID=UPI003711B3F6